LPCAISVTAKWTDDNNPTNTEDTEKTDSCSIYAIDVEIDPAVDFIAVGDTKGLTANVTPSVDGTFEWTVSPALSIEGSTTGQSVTIKGEEASSSVNGSSVSVEFISEEDDVGNTVTDTATESLTVVGIDKIKICVDTIWDDVTGSSIVLLKGSKYTFKAYPKPAGASWPSGKPVWSGVASGTENIGTVT